MTLSSAGPVEERVAAPAVSPLPLRRQLELLDGRDEETFDRILDLAAAVLDSKFAGILLNEAGRYWFKTSGKRTDGAATPSDGSLLAHTLAGDGPFWVRDAMSDPRFRHHPRVAGPPHIRFFNGTPLIAAAGRPVGAVAVMDDRPHDDPTPVQQRVLRQLADDIMSSIDSRTRSFFSDYGRATGEAMVGGLAELVISVTPDWTVVVFQQAEHGPLPGAAAPLGTDLWSLLPLPAGSRLRFELEKTMAERAIADFDEQVAPFDRPLNFRIFPLRPGGLTLCCREIGRATRAEAALRASESRLFRSEQHLARAQQLAQVGSAELDLDTGEHYWTEQVNRIFGRPADSPPPSVAEMVDTMVHPDDRALLRASHDRLFTGRAGHRFEYRIVRPGGEVRRVLSVAEAICDEYGAPHRVMVALQDVTELRAAEKERDEYERRLQHAQRLEALGTLAGGIAHDLNNMLLPVLALSKLTQGNVSDPEDRRNLEVIQQAAERARDLVQQILTFSRKNPIERRVIDLSELVAGTLRLARASIGADIRVVERLAPAVTAFADPAQLHQVVLNLVTNGVKAIGARAGTVTVELTPLADRVRLVVADDGAGMDERTRSRMFEPFFTTRAIGDGSGLGLSIVHGIVTGHGGTIAAESAPGNGTRVIVELPSHARIDAFAPASAAA